MKVRFKRMPVKRVLILGLLIMAMMPLAACGSEPTPTPSLEELGLSGSYVSVTGRVRPVQRAELSFSTPGPLGEVLVAEGDQVSEGQVLARLDAPELVAAVEQAQAAVTSAEAQLAKLQAGAREKEIASAEAAVDIAEAQLAQAQTGVIAAQAELERGRAALVAAQASLDLMEAGATEHERELARLQVERAKAERYSLQGTRDAVGGRVDKPGYQEGSFEAAEGQVMAAETAVGMAEIEKQILEEGARPQELEGARAQVAEAQAGVAALEQAVAQAENQVTLAEAQLAQTQAQLELIKAPARQEALDAAQAQVQQAQANLTASQAAHAKAELRAPFAGTVCWLDLRPGEYVAPGMPVMALGDLSELRVETTDLDELDVARIAPGMKAELTFDALTNVTLQGTIARIALKSSQASGGTTYETIINFDEPNERLRWGMTAFADIETE